MATRSLAEIQAALKAKGFDPGPIDGIPGRLTREAVTAFQKAMKLKINFPGTIGPKTLAALFGDTAVVAPLVEAPWLDLAIRKKGLNENRDYTALSKFLRSDGNTLGDPRKLPWCGDFVETCIAIPLPKERLPGNPYLARNWQKFGVHVAPTVGAIGAFWRTSKTKSTNGHVAFIDGESEDGKAFAILGGNQSNSVSQTLIDKGRLLDSRWPSTVDLPSRIHLPRMKNGRLSVNEA